MSKLISIITPTYNSELYIAEMINSVISQTYNNWELVITDDCSVDETVSLVRNIMLYEKRIKLFTLDKNSGSAIARNNSMNNSLVNILLFAIVMIYGEKIS